MIHEKARQDLFSKIFAVVYSLKEVCYYLIGFSVNGALLFWSGKGFDHAAYFLSFFVRLQSYSPGPPREARQPRISPWLDFEK